MKLLVSGTSGYIGGELVRLLCNDGHDVWSIGRTPVTIENGWVIKSIHADLRNPIERAECDFDCIVHVAGANDVDSLSPKIALESTVLTTRNMLAFANKQNCSRFLYVSTFQVYGMAEGIISETSVCRPVNDYALTHRFAEEWVELFGQSSDFRHVVARVANISGVPARGSMKRWTLVPGCFCHQAVEDQKIVLKSSGNQLRDFLSLESVVARLSDVITNFDDFADAGLGGYVNICAGVSLSIAEIASLVAQRYEARFAKPCQVEVLSNMPEKRNNPLQVESVFNQWNKKSKLTYQQAIDQMIASIDQTLDHLGRG